MIEQNTTIYVWNQSDLGQRPTPIILEDCNPKQLTYRLLKSTVAETLDINESQINIQDPNNLDIRELYDWSVQKSTIIQDISKIKVIISQSPPNPTIIGLTGPTRCGKGTLSGFLKHSLNSIILNLDEYYHDDDYIDKVLKGNWEIPEAYQWEKIYSAVGQAMEQCKQQQKQYLIIESFMLFYSKYLFELCDNRFFINITNEEIVKRRKGYQESYENYIEKTLIPATEKYINHIKTEYNENDISFIDGMQKRIDIFKQVKKVITKK